MVAVLAVALLAWPGGTGSPSQPGTPARRPVVPSTVYEPRFWQPTVQDSPEGAASMLFSGSGAGLGGIYYQSNVAVVAAGGSYRMLLGEMNLQAGTDALLSPDGSHVALSWSATHGSPLDAFSSGASVWVADLGTGKVRRYRLPGDLDAANAVPLGWSPDGHHVALSWRGDLVEGSDRVTATLALLDVSSGAVRSLGHFSLGQDGELNPAFSPDGRRVAVQAGSDLSVIDTTTGATRRLPELGPRQRLAGPGAWSTDGTRLAIATFDGCATGCRPEQFDARRWQLSYLDPGSGATAAGPAFDPIDAMVVRVLGWQAGGDVVALTYRCSSPPDYPAYDSDLYRPRLVALHPGGGQRNLIALPDYVRRIDIAHDAVTADRFGGPAPRPAALPLAHWVYRVAAVLVAGFAVLLTLVVVVVRRVRRR
ncbi:MAG TPA: WD40 repeat domain-containing protein [Rugosimonospora sp.]